MSNLQRILVAVDFGPGSDLALQHATALARRCGAVVAAVHAVEYLPFSALAWEGLDRDIQSELRRRLEAAEAPTSEDPEQRTFTRTGKPARVVCSFADHWDADLVVASAGHLDPHGRFNLGTTADRILRLSDRPVLLVDPRANSVELKSMLCAIDCTEASTHALDAAAQLAAGAKAVLEVFTVQAERGEYPHLESMGAAISDPWYAVGQLAPVGSSGESTEYDTRLVEEMKRFVERSRFADTIENERIVKAHSPLDGILAEVKRTDCDLLVMGSRGRGPVTAALLGSVTENVARRMECSLLVVP